MVATATSPSPPKSSRRIRQVASMCTPIEYMHPSAQVSLLPNGISISSVVFAGFTVVTNTKKDTHKPTHSVCRIIDTAGIVCEARSMKCSRVRPSVCPSVCLSHHLTAAESSGGFAAERRGGRRYRSIAASTGRPAAAAPRHGAAARRSAASASSVTLTGDVGS